MKEKTEFFLYIRSFLGVAFSTIAYADFPDLWGDLIDNLLALAQTNDPTQIYSACFCLKLLFQKFAYVFHSIHKRHENLYKICRYQDKKAIIFHSVIDKTFPILLNVWGNVSTITNNESAEIQLLITKIFFSSFMVS